MSVEKKDLVIPHELLSSFEGNIRIFHGNPTAGIWPVDPILLKKVLDHYPELAKSQRIKEHFNVAVVYKGKDIKKDIEKSGIKLEETRIIKDIFIRGIPVPDIFLKDLKLDPAKFEVIIAEK
jgi:hypothetical protein